MWEHVAVTLPARLKKARELRGLGVRELARQAQTTGGTISRMEAGALGKRPSEDMISKLAAALSVRSRWLLTGEDPMEEMPAEPGGILPKRAEGARIAREGAVDERAIQSVLDDPPPPGSEAWPPLRWANRMQLREAELFNRFDEARATHIPPPPPSHPPVSTSRPTPTPVPVAQETPPAKRKAGKG